MASTYFHILGLLKVSTGKDWQQQGHFDISRSEGTEGGSGNSASEAMKVIVVLAAPGVYLLVVAAYGRVPSAVEARDNFDIVGVARFLPSAVGVGIGPWRLGAFCVSAGEPAFGRSSTDKGAAGGKNCVCALFCFPERFCASKKSCRRLRFASMSRFWRSDNLGASTSET